MAPTTQWYPDGLASWAATVMYPREGALDGPHDSVRLSRRPERSCRTAPWRRCSCRPPGEVWQESGLGVPQSHPAVPVPRKGNTECSGPLQEGDAASATGPWDVDPPGEPAAEARRAEAEKAGRMAATAAAAAAAAAVCSRGEEKGCSLHHACEAGLSMCARCGSHSPPHSSERESRERETQTKHLAPKHPSKP